jgi:MFS family permease
VPHLHETLGYSLSTAGLVVSLITLGQLGGIAIGGVLGDRSVKHTLAAGCMGAHMIALLLVAHATALPMVLAFAVLHGVAWGMRGPLMASIRADYFGRAAFGMIAGLSAMITTLGNTLGPLIAGVMVDLTGTYVPGLTVLALMAGLGSVLFLLATPPPPPVRRTDTIVATAPFTPVRGENVPS